MKILTPGCNSFPVGTEFSFLLGKQKNRIALLVRATGGTSGGLPNYLDPGIYVIPDGCCASAPFNRTEETVLPVIKL
jgi:hypothetical protein